MMRLPQSQKLYGICDHDSMIKLVLSVEDSIILFQGGRIGRLRIPQRESVARCIHNLAQARMFDHRSDRWNPLRRTKKKRRMAPAEPEDFGI